MPDRSIFERLVEARKEAGLPYGQRAIARELGVSPSAVNVWKQQEGNMRLSHALELAYSAGVCTEWLLTGRPPKYAADKNSTLGQLHRELEGLSEADLQLTLDFARFRKQSG